jgi:hypothetical protein
MSPGKLDLTFRQVFAANPGSSAGHFAAEIAVSTAKVEQAQSGHLSAHGDLCRAEELVSVEIPARLLEAVI